MKIATTNGDSNNHIINMDAPTLRPKFLPKPDELGLVAVGFSGGQVCIWKPSKTAQYPVLHHDNSANQAPMQLPWP